LIRRAFPAARVDSLGFASALAAPRVGERHLDLDLNRAAAGPPRSVEPYDAIVFAEVIEHLAAPPREVLGLLAGLLAPGGFIALQTPNALALHKRLRALAGRSPLGAGGGVAAPSHSQAHFREYTLAELEELGRTVGLEPEEARIANHFRHPGLAARAYDRLTAALPPGTRQGITVYLRRPRA
jgi:trans-aconitate methyltransferase